MFNLKNIKKPAILYIIAFVLFFVTINICYLYAILLPDKKSDKEHIQKKTLMEYSKRMVKNLKRTNAVNFF